MEWLPNIRFCDKKSTCAFRKMNLTDNGAVTFS